MAPRHVAWLAGVAFGPLLLVASVSPVLAHALLQSGDPAPGSSVATSPTQVTITFGEAPDPALSRVEVLDANGRTVAGGSVAPAASDADVLVVAVPPLANGIYTVVWRTVSAVDGHLATGSYAFGVGVDDADLPATQVDPGGTSSVSPLGVLGHWLLFLGLAGMLGGATVAHLVDGRPSHSTVPLTVGSLGLAGAGTALVLVAHLTAAGVDPMTALDTSLGSQALIRMLPLWLAGGGLLILWRRPERTVAGLWIVGLGATLGMLADVVASHAAARGDTWVAVPIQWLHVLGVGIWMGGLVALLLGLGTEPGARTARLARRFAVVATVGIVLVGATGLLRAIAQVGSLGALVNTPFGILVSAKTVLFGGLAGLGAVNHFRNVPVAGIRLRGLRIVGRSEVVVGAVVLLLAAGLVEVAPPAAGSAVEARTAGPAPSGAPAAATTLSVTGEDFGRSVRLSVDVAPGTVGRNTFQASIRDVDTGAPVPADHVSLRFRLVGRPDIGTSRLDLTPVDTGIFSGTGTNLSIAGPWQVTATVTSGASAVEVPLLLPVVAQDVSIDVQRTPSLPPISTVRLVPDGTLQVYADPATSGPNQVHVTFFDAAGQELPVTSAEMVATGVLSTQLGVPTRLAARMLEPGHFVATTRPQAGPADLYVFGRAPDGGTLSARIPLQIVP